MSKPRQQNSIIASSSATTALAVGSVSLIAGLVGFYWDTAIGSGSYKLKQKLHRLPSTLPILGDALTVIKNLPRFHDFFVENFERSENKTIHGSIPFEPPYIFVNDPKAVEHILKTKFTTYDKGQFFYVRCQDVLGHGIFNVDGDQWRSQRKTAANIFNVKNFKDFVGIVFADEMASLSSRLSSYAESGEAFDLQDLFFRFTLDSFCKIGFGIDLHCLDSTEPVAFAVAFDRAQERMQNRFTEPLWNLRELLPSVGPKQRANVKVIREFGRGIIEKKRAEYAAIEEQEGPGNEKADLLTMLMSIKNEDGESPSDEQLCDYVLNFIIAGRDTTAQALSWTFLMLSRNPNTLAKLLEEIKDTLGDATSPTYDQIKSMKYANAVFHETLRLYPSVPTEIKTANQDDTLPDGTFVPKGAVVSWSPYCMGRTTAIWGPDAKEFRPERWLEMERNPSPFDYPVFNAGPRVCLGKNMAELEGVFVIVSMLRLFEVSVLEGEKVTYANSVTLPMKDGLKVKVCKRRDI